MQLKQEIAELDQKLVSSCSTKQEFNFPSQAILNKKDQERDEIMKKINSMRMSTSGKGETLQSQLIENQNKMKVLGIKRQNELNSSKHTREKLSQKINSQNKSLQNHYEEIQLLSTVIAKKQKLKEESSMAKAKAYEDSLIPLEQEAEKQSKDKENLLAEQIKLHEELIINENIYFMCKEEMLSRYTQRAEYIGQREEIEVDLECFEMQYADDLEYLTEEDNCSYQNNSNIKLLKEKYEEKLDILTNSIENNSLLIETLERKYSKIISEIEDLISSASEYRNNAEICMMEKVIAEKSDEFDIDSLENVILDLNALEKFDIDEEILRLQLEEVLKNENKLKSELEYEEADLLEKINICIAEGKNSKSLEEELEFIRNRYRNRFAAIYQWKEEVEAVINRTISNLQVSVQDRTIIEEYCAGLGKISNNSIKKQMINLIENYSAKVQIRDKVIQQHLPQIKKKYAERSQISNMLIQASQEKSKLQAEHFIINKEFQQGISKENLSGKTNKNGENNSNSIKNKALNMRSTLMNLEKIISNEVQLYEKNHEFLQEIVLKIKNIKKSLSNIRYSLNKISSEEHNLHFRIEKILENKRRDMLSSLQELSYVSKESEELRLSDLKQRIDEITSEIEVSTKELNKFDLDVNASLALIEQEELILKTQQQAIESAMRNIEIENKRIKEMEQQLVKLEETEAAPIPECLQDQTRSKSVPRIASSKQNENANMNINENINASVTAYTNETKESEESVIINNGNPYLDYVEKTLGRHISLSTDRSLFNQQRAPIKKSFKLSLEDTNQIERSFFEKIMPLLEGAELYKKFSQRSTLKQQSFDPLDVIRTPPEVCGYGLRQFKLNKSINTIDVKQPLKPGFDNSIQVDYLLTPIIPQITMAILKIQKHLGQEELDFDRVPDKSYEKMKEIGVIDTNSQAFRERCKNCIWYPFSLALIQGGRVELIAKGYQTFRYWVNGINALVKYKKVIPKLRQRIESSTSL